MSNTILVGRIPHEPILRQEGPSLVVQAAGGRPFQDSTDETGPPPAAAARAEVVFESIGIGLIFLIALTALWILIRHRR